MRILEVGAGVASVTHHVVTPLLNRGVGETEEKSVRFLGYDYADIPKSLFEKAQQQFSYANTS